jgi:lipopolysaccharide heptosyltransferase II
VFHEVEGCSALRNGLNLAAAKEYAVRIPMSAVRILTSPAATLAYGRWVLGIGDEAHPHEPPIDDVRSILVVRPDGIGDAILTGPLLRELRRAYPQARIALVVAPHSWSFFEFCPYVNRVVAMRIPRPMSVTDTWWRPLARRALALSLARHHLSSPRYDVAIAPRWGIDRYDAIPLAYLSGATSRVGYSERVSVEKRKQNQGYDRFLTHIVDDRSIKHEVVRNLSLLPVLGAKAHDQSLEAWLSDKDADFANEVLASSQEQPRVALGPGAGHPRRMWPVARFAEVGRWLIERGARVIVVGGPNDEGLGDELRRRLGSAIIDLTSKTSLRESAAVLMKCALFCGNDGGPMHLAAAAGIPIIEISCHPQSGHDLHPNSPVRFGPWGVPHRILRPEALADGCTDACRVRSPHCILNVGVESAVEAIASLIDETGGL